MLTLYVKAPFAVFRTFHTGSFRPTAPFITPSAAYGLVLNLAGVETRFDDGKSPMTLMKDNLPILRIALGAVVERGKNTSRDMHPKFPGTATVFQQLHNYPVGNSGKEHAAATMGTKYNIIPVRREFLYGFEALIRVDADRDLETRVQKGLEGQLPEPRYGLPFLGDNAFMPDVIEVCDQEKEAYWLEKMTLFDINNPPTGAIRLTVWIDRADMSKTTSHLYVPTNRATAAPPASAWTHVGPPQ